MVLFRPPIDYPYSNIKLALITGLSNPYSCNLSRIQKNFLSRLEFPHIVPYNFPYLPSSGEENEPLWKASMENMKQFLMYQTSYYQHHLRLHLNNFISSCEQIIFLSGSCGLEILTLALSQESKTKVARVFAYGPVAKRHPDFPCTFIQGSKDYVSRYFFKKVDYRIPHLGHLDYLQHPEVFNIIQQGLKTYVQD